MRFHNADVVWRVDDRRDVPDEPAEREFLHYRYFFDHLYYEPASRTLSVPQPAPRAMNVNALGQVPDSTWFTNRIGVRDLSPERVRRGPVDDGGPVRPFTVVGGKRGGKQAGFTMEDARGVRYITKFDRRGKEELQTGADAVTVRLLWALGYHVPADSVVFFERSDLSVAPDATRDDVYGDEVPFTAEDLDAMLRDVGRTTDGRIRGLASRYLPGRPLGGFPEEGVRADDPNDRVPHQHRRELRALGVVFDWLAHTDVKEDNTLDMWTEAAGGERHHVMHYLLDFGHALGARSRPVRNPADSHAHLWDWAYLLKSLPAFGLWKRPWEGIDVPALRGVGRFTADGYVPGIYKPRMPWAPLRARDDLDAFWAARLLMRLRPEHIHAAVEAGRYASPDSREYLADVLIERRRMVARHWFREVNPLARFEVAADGAGARVCFADLLLLHGLEDVAADTVYRVRTWDDAGEAVGRPREVSPDDEGRACVTTLLGGGPEGYTIVGLETRRAKGDPVSPVKVHLARHPETGAPRLIGVWRR
ncbi:MAG: hypothetical protein ACQEXJ_24160 [Myxococcota bacterium]